MYHAHYSLSAIVATLSNAKPLVVSLMGSDVKEAGILKPIVRFCSKKYWQVTIVKSEDMKNSLGLEYLKIIPNGIDTDLFKPLERESSLRKVKWDPAKHHILFAASRLRPEKNFPLFESAMNRIQQDDIEIHSLEEVDHELMPYYYNASSVIVLLSKHEGSPNVIKEAMACNRPIVATNVGDIKENIETTKGCFIVDPYPEDVANKIKLALEFDQTNGRFNIRHLRSDIIAEKLIEVYNDL